MMVSNDPGINENGVFLKSCICGYICSKENVIIALRNDYHDCYVLTWQVFLETVPADSSDSGKTGSLMW